MPSTKSAKKRVRQNVVRRVRNKARRTRVKTGVREVKDALKTGDLDAARAAYRGASGLLDRAAQKRVIHRNKVNRIKSRLAKQINTAKKEGS